MHNFNYHAINDCYSESVTDSDVDAAAIAGVIDRAILPLKNAEAGHVLNRKSGYTCTGSLSRKFAQIEVFDESAHIITLGVCLHSRAGKGLWQRMCSGLDNAYAEQPAPPAPWAAMRYHCPEIVLPDWIDWWCKTAAYALIEDHQHQCQLGADASGHP